MAKQPLSAFSESARPALDMDCRESFTTFLHWAAVIPERESQSPAFWHTDPAMSPPLWRQPVAPAARIPTAIVAENIFRIRDLSFLFAQSIWDQKPRGDEGRRSGAVPVT
jgi:hypothetical protein